MNFVLTGDNNYIAPLGVCMTSILLNLADDRCARFFVFAENFTNDDIDKLYEIKNVRPCEVVIVNMKQYTHLFSCIDTSKFSLTYVNLVCYFRLLMLDILPDDVDKCFYIDGDMIIDSDLSYLYDSFDEKNIIGAVIEILAMQYRNDILKHFMQWDDLANFQRAPLKNPYFNAGFFLLNVKKAKELNLFQKAFDFLDKHPNPPYADQDTLNYIIGQQYPQLVQHFPPSYNVFCDMFHDVNLYNDAFYSKDAIQEAFIHPKIYHYGGPNKPWINRKVRFFYSIWWRYCSLSPWWNLKEPDAETETNNSENICSLLHVRLFNFFPIFKKKANHNEKSYYLFGVRFLLKKQITSYMKSYRIFGLKFKRFSILKMYELNQVELKNIVDLNFNNLNNMLNSQFNQLNNMVNRQFKIFENVTELQFHNLKNAIDLETERLTNGIDYNAQNFERLDKKIVTETYDVRRNLIDQISNLSKKVEIMNSVFVTHQNTFLPFKNMFEGKNIVIVATGSSLNRYIPIPDTIHIGVNRAYKFESIMLDFLFIQDISGLKNEISNINEYGKGKCIKFYGDVLPIEQCAIPESYLIKSDAKRYYTGGMNTPFVRDISSCLLPDFGSVVFSALAFALYTNPKKLYLVGCDCSDTGYFDNYTETISSSLKGDLPNIFQGWQKFKTFANHFYPDTDIISINPVGLKGVFHDIEQS